MTKTILTPSLTAIRRLIAFLLVALIPACGGTAGSRMKATFVPRISLVEIIFKSLDESVFFAGPLLFNEVQGKDKLQIDFTSVVKNNLCDSVRCNFTVLTENMELSFQKITLKLADTSIIRTNYDTLFKDTDQKKIKYRYTYFIRFYEFLKLLDSPSAQIILKDDYSFQAIRRWKKDTKEIKTKLQRLISSY